MNVFLEVTHVLVLTVSILMEASIAHLVILVLLVMECLAVSYFIAKLVTTSICILLHSGEAEGFWMATCTYVLLHYMYVA